MTDRGLAASDSNSWLMVIAVMLTAMLEVLDMTIVNVALPHMLGAFGATSNQITWVLTAYLVAAAVVMPLTGFLVKLLGRQRLLVWSIAGFVVSSGLCGAAWSLESMVLFRLCQGIFGATLVPLSQAILLDATSVERRGQAMAVWGLGIMLAPVLGPVLGGWIVEQWSWRLVFYINLPIGIMALLMVAGKLAPPTTRPRTDWLGLVLLALAVGSLQFVLDQGESREWFSSSLLRACTALSLVSFVVFVARGWARPGHIVDLQLFRDRNFLLASLSILGFGMGMFGSIAVLPLLTQSLLGYPADAAGALFIPRGISTGLTLALTGGVLMRFVDARVLIGIGLLITAYGSWQMTGYYLEVDRWHLIWPGVVQGVGIGLVFVPLTTIAFSTLPPAKNDEAAGLFGLMRGLGASFGIAVTSTLLVSQAAVHRGRLGEQISPFNPNLHAWLMDRGLTLADPAAVPSAAMLVAREAQMLAYIDTFWFLTCSLLALVPLVMLMREPPRQVGNLGAH